MEVVRGTLQLDMDISKISSGVSQAQGLLQKLKLPENVRKQFDQLFSKANSDLNKYQEKMKSGFKTKGDVTGIEKSGNALKNSLAQLEKEWAKLSTMDLSKMITLDSSQQQRIQQINNTFKELGNKLKNVFASLFIE